MRPMSEAPKDRRILVWVKPRRGGYTKEQGWFTAIYENYIPVQEDDPPWRIGLHDIESYTSLHTSELAGWIDLPPDPTEMEVV